MEITMSSGNSAALFTAMVILALIPSTSSLAVLSRSATSGFVHGVFTTGGIIAGDIFFILFAIFGLAVLAQSSAELFTLIKYLGGSYLIWMGIQIWRSKTTGAASDDISGPSLKSSFVAGLLITLGDQKVILFYLGFFPAFLDLSKISYLDIGIIIAITAAALSTAKLCYAYIGNQAGSISHPGKLRYINMTASGLMVAVGLFIIVST